MPVDVSNSVVDGWNGCLTVANRNKLTLAATVFGDACDSHTTTKKEPQ